VLDLVERARKEGWRLVALDCRFDSATATGSVVAGALASARRSEWRKVAAGTRPQAHPRSERRGRQCKDPGVSRSVAERIASLRSAGESYRAIAAALNQDRIASLQSGEWARVGRTRRAAYHPGRGAPPPRAAR
jgi:hypothetical protein